MEVKRGEVILADLDKGIGSEQCGLRPVLVIQNDVGNAASTTVIVACITSKPKIASQPTHVGIRMEWGNMSKYSLVILEQIQTIDKKRLIKKIGRVTEGTMKCVDAALKVSLALGKRTNGHRLN